jgi:hypothetical protein
MALSMAVVSEPSSLSTQAAMAPKSSGAGDRNVS